MSTRATYHFTGKHALASPTVYCHHDGYPSGAAQYFHAMAAYTAPSKGGLAELFIRANADEAELTGSHNSHGDTEFRYTLNDGDLTAWKYSGSGWVAFYSGSLADFVKLHAPELEPIVMLNRQPLTLSRAILAITGVIQQGTEQLAKGWTGNANGMRADAERMLAAIDPSHNGPEVQAVRTALASLAGALEAPRDTPAPRTASVAPRVSVVVPQVPALPGMTPLGIPESKPAGPVKFRKYSITDGTTVVRVSFSLDGMTDGGPCVTLYARDYDRNLGKLIPEGYENHTDTMTDYFDKGHVTLRPGHPLYAPARARAEAVQASRAARSA